jgi:hypothetical protein
LNRKLTVSIGIGLVVIVVLSLFLVQNWFSQNQTATREVYVGVMFAYGNEISQLKALVDKVKDYTNFFVLGSVELLFNETALTESCDYIYDAQLNFIVQFRRLDLFNFSITDWMQSAQQRYGSQFLGIYRYDEPGGNQIDDGPAQIINSTVFDPDMTYTQMAQNYVGNLSAFPTYYLNYSPRIFTSDYALYWFDYKANYTTVFAEFVGNQSRQRHIALCRGAAETFDKDWGTIITWKYNQDPYLENGEELYNDLALAYSAGSKYIIVFSYPEITPYGILTEEHFSALQHFWNTLRTDPGSFGSNSAEVAYVLPADYGSGLRSADDGLWGFFPPDQLSAKIYSDIETLTSRYGAKLNILYDEPQTLAVLGNYSQVFFWNQTIS